MSARGEHAFEDRPDHVAKLVFGGRAVGPTGRRNVLAAAEMGAFDALDVEPFFIAEVVIDRGQVDAGALTNLADRGGPIAFFGEDRAGGFQQSQLGIIDVGHRDTGRWRG